MVLNKLAKERLDHETIITALTELLWIDKWDDTNFLSFESLVLSQVQHVRSNETKLSYQLLWKKYQEKKKMYKFKSTISLFGDQISALLETQPSFASWWAAGFAWVWALSVK